MRIRVALPLLLTAALYAQEGDQGPPRLKRGKPATAAESKSGASSTPPLREIVTDQDGNVIQQTGTGGAKEPSLPAAGSSASPGAEASATTEMPPSTAGAAVPARGPVRVDQQAACSPAGMRSSAAST